MLSNRSIEETIRLFPRWHYEFDLAGHKTPIFDPSWINRHAQRKRYMFEPLLRLCGGTLKGKRVLDLGCNAGFWSLGSVEADCRFVLGIDGRQMHIDQANFVFQVRGIEPDRYQFRCGNIFEILEEKLGVFDIVLCLGLFYHINKHINLLEMISRINRDLLVIDTAVCPGRGSLLEIRPEPLDEPRNAVDYDLVMVPTRGAVLDMVQIFGYQAVVLPPAFTDWTGSEDFQEGTRRAFMCSKQTPLASLPAENTPGEDEIERFSGRQLARALARKIWGRFRLPW